MKQKTIAFIVKIPYHFFITNLIIEKFKKQNEFQTLRKSKIKPTNSFVYIFLKAKNQYFLQSQLSCMQTRQRSTKMDPKADENLYVMSGVTDIERDFSYISTMLRWNETRFFGPSPRGFYHAADFFLTYAAQRIMVRKRQADVTIIGYAEFSYYPLISALPPDCWIHWLKHHFW